MVPVYEEMEGWAESTRGVRSWARLPRAAATYVRRIEALVGAPVIFLERVHSE